MIGTSLGVFNIILPNIVLMMSLIILVIRNTYKTLEKTYNKYIYYDY